MAKKQKIPCRVCGKLFEPCAYCKSHSDVFRWRNFACSRECAAKYIKETTEYRESLRNTKKNPEQNKAAVDNTSKDKTLTEKKKATKKLDNHVTESNKKTD